MLCCSSELVLQLLSVSQDGFLVPLPHGANCLHLALQEQHTKEDLSNLLHYGRSLFAYFILIEDDFGVSPLTLARGTEAEDVFMAVLDELRKPNEDLERLVRAYIAALLLPSCPLESSLLEMHCHEAHAPFSCETAHAPFSCETERSKSTAAQGHEELINVLIVK